MIPTVAHYIHKGIISKVLIKSITNFLIIFFIFQQLKSQISEIDQNGFNPFCDETLHFLPNANKTTVLTVFFGRNSRSWPKKSQTLCQMRSPTPHETSTVTRRCSFRKYCSHALTLVWYMLFLLCNEIVRNTKRWLSRCQNLITSGMVSRMKKQTRNVILLPN